MKIISRTLLAVILLGLTACASKPAYRDQYGNRTDNPQVAGGGAYVGNGSPAFQPAEQPAPDAWPKVFVSGGTTNTIYQTQVESWDGGSLVARNAVAVQAAGQPQPIYGVITVRGTTAVNETDQTVSLLNLQIVKAEFPSAPEKAEQYLRVLRQEYPQKVQVFSLPTLQASLAANQQHARAAALPLDNTPPQIIVSEKPAILVLIDGDPVFRPVTGTDLQRVLNTRALVLKDPSGKLYLRLPAGYLEASTLGGPWALSQPPRGATVAEKEVRDSGQVDGLEADGADAPPGTIGSAPPPVVYVSSKPAELVVFAGPPNYLPIPGTDLLYVTNTTANVFKLLSDQQNYVLLSGRWFKAPSFAGPWTYVPGDALPNDFARIPDDSPKENVKASIPGTAQAQEALIANSVPQTAPIERGAQMPPPQIDGPPQLAPISGTPLYYVVNSGVPIIKVDDHSWYACQNGVWYVATALEGPWVAADSVPAVIYSIPPSSPLHYVTYVRVYNANDRVVYDGYTPGYMGTVVNNDAVVVYGTGYYYRPWVGSVWYGPPVTWGFGWDPFWSPWTGWSFGYGFGWYGFYYPHYHHHWAFAPCPWWGPYRYYARSYAGRGPAHGPDGWAHTSANIYRDTGAPYVARADTINRRPPPAANAVYGRAYNSRTGALVAGERAQVGNVFRNPPPPSTLPRQAGGPAFANRGSRAPSPSTGSWSMEPSRTVRSPRSESAVGGAAMSRSGRGDLGGFSPRGSAGFRPEVAPPGPRGGFAPSRSAPAPAPAPAPPPSAPSSSRSSRGDR